MKTTIQLFTFFLLGFALISCGDDDGVILLPVEAETFSNLHAPLTSNPGEPPSGDFVKFSFSEGAVVSGDDWDIAFRGTEILVNGGEVSAADQPGRTGTAAGYVATGTFGDISSVNTNALAEDSAAGPAIPGGSGNGWYTYNPATFIVSPIAGKVLVFRTNDGKYAKMEILSYYEDAPANPDALVNASRYYTFNYVYQPNAGQTSFE